MARKIIDTGVVGNDGTGDSIRDSFRKVNDNFRELYSSLGLGDKLTFIGLDDIKENADPDSKITAYVGLNDPVTGATPVVTVNNDESGLTFKTITAGSGISLDYTTNPREISINSEFAAISADPDPSLGGDLKVSPGITTNRIRLMIDPEGLTTIPGQPILPVTQDEAVNKRYADSKISRAGVNSIDPETGNINAAMGRMSGPLILSRDPEPDDDLIYNGLVAATKRYVDNSAFGSVANLYVATSGQDDRVGVSKELQGRALAYAYRTIEAACKRAEELVLEAREEIGPYRKVLTYNNGEYECYLTAIETSPTSGVGFAAEAIMSVDTINLVAGGSNYNEGDRLTLVGGDLGVGGQAAIIEVLTTVTTPGAILTYRVVTTGSYVDVPGATNIATTSDSVFGVGATFDVTYKVNNVTITNQGSGYSLVSVRITGGGGAGAFGTADVVSGQIVSITITDQGSGFTSLPTVVADLPRFKIFTNGLRTDYTGDVLNNTPAAIRTRDVREGLFLRGVDSGALAQILAHDGSLDGDDEVFDVDIKYGTFQIGETIAYGDVSKSIQITILVESGIYEENLPIKVPQNCSIVGDEFRRCIVRPKPGTSSSPWAFKKFRRDLINDGLVTAENDVFGHHYLQDSSAPVYPKIANKGFYRAAAKLLELNRTFIQEEVVAWIANQSETSAAPFSPSFEYNENLCKRDVGLIIDSMIFDLKWGGYDRTISAALKYFQSASSLIAITTQKDQTLAAIDYINVLAQQVIDNAEITTIYQDLFIQVIDNAFIAESGTDQVINDLFITLKDVIDESGSVNYPKENDQMDMFLANDAVRWQAITGQGHGGFMCVLDPEGQILAKSPYAQECASFSKSINEQTFAGGMFIDGFAGNLQFQITQVECTTRLRVGGLDRIPNLPCSFIVQDVVYRVNYVRDFIYNKDGSTATLVLDETTPWPFDLFEYDSATCSRDVGYIIDGLGYDIVLGTNFNARKSGLTYRGANASVVILNQKQITINALNYAHDLAKAELTGYTTQQAVVDSSKTVIADIVERGPLYAPTLSFTNPPGLTTALANAKALLISNIEFIKDEVLGYLVSTYPALSYDTTKCARDVQYIIEALIYDLIYGGNSQTRDAGLKYYSSYLSGGPLQVPAPTQAATAAGIAWAKYVAKQVIVSSAPTPLYSATPRQTGSASDSGTQARIETLLTDVSDIITNGIGAADALVLPDLTIGYNAGALTSRTTLQTNKSDIQSAVIDYVNLNGNLHELLMPGNRSILCNDYTQVNDLGYGIFATNGGLVEAVSMFTYYCHISYYSLNGAQIRSVGGSSAHGNYALVAEGSDPLEVPTPTGLYYDLAQRVVCYAPSPGYYNAAGGLYVYVNGCDYTPIGGSELEVDHGGLIYRYPVTSVVVEGLPTGVFRLNLTSDSTGNFDGLYDQILDGVKMSLRLNSLVYLTGDLVEVSVRPSTGLRLRENADIYRVLQFDGVNDPNGPYVVNISIGSPGNFEIRKTITTITSTTTVTTSTAHGLKKGYKVIARATSNNLISGATYYVKDVVSSTQFTLSQTASGASGFTLSNGTGLSISICVQHGYLENYYVQVASTGTLPTPLLASTRYYVSAEGLTETNFRLASQQNGSAINITAGGTGTYTIIPDGITRTTLRENYNFIDFTVYQPGEFVTSGAACTFTTGATTTVNRNSHGFAAGNVIKFETTGTLPVGLSVAQNYFVISAGLGLNSFRISETPGGLDITSSGGSGTHTVGLVTGRAGDSSFAVVAVSPSDTARANGTKFVFKGEEYIVSNYQSEGDTNKPYGRINLNRPLVDSIINYGATYTLRAGVPARTIQGTGSLTIRISLTRVTSHDILEVGTGSYADTNYPNEIYGPAVNALAPENETAERDVGRVFYVTTDQFGNFRVGPYFSVDQGTGRVTFSAAIALSNLDGIGFKRGVPIAEFSVDSSFSDNATDTVPTENAARIYIERRLGITHAGTAVPSDQLIPAFTGGFMSLDGQLGMKNSMDMNQYRIRNLANPVNPQDAVNLRSLTFDNFQSFSFTGPVDAGDLLVFTGSSGNAINATVVGDLTFDLITGQDSALSQVTAQINPEVIGTADINTAAAIDQFKLSLDNSYATTAASVTGATGTRSGTTVTLSYLGPPSAPYTAGQKITVSGFSSTLYNGTFAVITCSSSSLTYNISTGTNAFAATQSTWTAALAATPTTAIGTGTIVPQKGISSFDTVQFTVTNGFVTVKNNGLTLGKLQQISSNTVLGNSNISTSDVTTVGFSTVVDTGGAIKKSQYSSTGFVRRTNVSSFASDGDYVIIEASSAASGYVISDASKLIQRDSNGDFGANVANIQQLKVDSQIAIDSGTTTTGGFIKLYGFGAAGGILVSSGSLGADKVNYYDNDAHVFRPQSGIGYAPITVSQLQTTAITTGGNTTGGTITGRWTLTGTSPNESRLQATYSADLAEYYEGDKEYEVGTVLVFGGDKEVTLTDTQGDTRVAGVVSNTAAFVMYDACPGHKNLVALQGRVPCKVVGKIRKGDMLVTSRISGVAVAAGADVKVGTVVGKALTDYDNDHIGTIEIAVGRT